ncbi:MAG: hypothetical protein K2G91_02400 [Prevotella sp.]|nr:hypothetical protein [Prevotella sp.]
MKIYSKIIMMLTAVLVFTACSDDDDFAAGEQEKAGVQSAYFNQNAYLRSIEVEPEAASFDITVSRWNTESAATVGITVVNNEENVFDVPASVSFAAGQADAVLTVTAPRAAEGVNYGLTLGIAEEDRSIYGQGFREIAVDFAILTWEDLGTGYFLDGTVSTYFGVNPSVPMAVNVKKTVTATGECFRFASPLAFVATALDEAGIGYNGYPYNEPGDCDEQEHMIVIDIMSKGPVMRTTELGMDWGYGMFKVSSIDYGTYDKSKGIIAFPAGSLGIEMSNYNPGKPADSANPTYLFLSADAYLSFLEAGDEE